MKFDGMHALRYEGTVHAALLAQVLSSLAVDRRELAMAFRSVSCLLYLTGLQ
jgi:hypothetical protein